MVKWGEKVRSRSRGTTRTGGPASTPEAVPPSAPAEAPSAPEAPAPVPPRENRTFGGFSLATPVLVVVDDEGPVPDLAGLGGEVLLLSGATEDRYHGGHRSVVLVTADRASLRRVVPRLPKLGRVRSVACWLHADGTGFVASPAPTWPPVRALSTRPAGDGVMVGLTVRGALRAVEVLRAFAVQAAPARAARGGLQVAALRSAPYAGPPGTSETVEDLDEALSPERVVPPDVVLVDGPTDLLPAAHPTTGRPAVLVAPVPVAPVDEHLHNPHGFDPAADGPVLDAAALAALGATDRLPLAVLAELRSAAGVRLDVGAAATRLVLELAASGVPVEASGSDPLLSPDLAAALGRPVDLADTEQRELHSLAVRRAALETHGSHAWRRGLAGRAGVRFVDQPATSILLATRRPDQLAFALRQVARQDVEAQLVLAAHGFSPDRALVAEILGDRPHVVLEQPADAVFGDVLDHAAERADGRLLVKMDDDDWYSPRMLRDLLLARRYSGAEVVGMNAEFVHLAELDLTVRRDQVGEVFAAFAAGGATLVERDVLAEAGGYRRVVRHVDAQLLDAVLGSGARVYRTHGLGYVLRRRASGHTWTVAAEEFRREGTVVAEWPGFRPSPEAEVAREDRP